MVYSAVYIYKVKENNVKRFMEIHREVADIFRDLGARSVMYGGRDLAAKYSCYSFFSFFNCDGRDRLYIGMDSFDNKEHFRKVMRKFDSNKRVEELYDEVSDILDISSIVRGEFEQVI